jgi:hypothetical protein
MNKTTEEIVEKEEWQKDPSIAEAIRRVFGGYNADCLVKESFIITGLFAGIECPHFKDYPEVMDLYYTYHIFFSDSQPREEGKEIKVKVHVVTILLFYLTYSMYGCTKEYGTVNKGMIMEETVKILKDYELTLM